MIYKLYQKQVEAWKERFGVQTDLQGHESWTYLHTKDIEQTPEPEDLLSSRHKDTIELIEALKSHVDGMGFVNPAEAGQFAMHTDGYNQAIEEVVEYLDSQIKLIKNEQ